MTNLLVFFFAKLRTCQYSHYDEAVFIYVKVLGRENPYMVGIAKEAGS
jgi:hypothetical protein